MGPLAGVRVLEFAGLGPTPFCGMMLSDLGADVVRIDRASAVGQTQASSDGMTEVTSRTLGRGRRSVALDLKHPEGRDLALSLVGTFDALIEGHRPGVMERLGLGPAPCFAQNERLVYGRMTGWGQSGPLSDVAGHDINYIATAGALRPLGEPGVPPTVPLNLIGDFGGGGMLLALGITAALLEAQSSNVGQVVDTSMVSGSALLMTMMYELQAMDLWTEHRGQNLTDGAAPFYRTYQTADGEYVAIGALEQKFYDELLQRTGLSAEQLPDRWDRQNWSELSERFETLFRTRTRAEWCDLLEGTDTCFAPVLHLSEAKNHRHNVATDLFTDVAGVPQPTPAPRFSRTHNPHPAGAHDPGADTDDVLAELGLSRARIGELRSAAAIA